MLLSDEIPLLSFSSVVVLADGRNDIFDWPDVKQLLKQHKHKIIIHQFNIAKISKNDI